MGFNNKSRNNSNIESFYNGIYCLYTNQLAEAKKFLLQALNGTEKIDLSYFEYLSYLGLVEVLSHKSKGGLQRCYNAVKGFSNDPELFLNIAYAEFVLGNRRRSIKAIQQSLEADAGFTHAYHFHKCIGKRKRNNLKRTSPGKKLFGRFFRREKNRCNKETFDKVFKEHLASKLDCYIEDIIKQK